MPTLEELRCFFSVEEGEAEEKRRAVHRELDEVLNRPQFRISTDGRDALINWGNYGGYTIRAVAGMSRYGRDWLASIGLEVPSEIRDIIVAALREEFL